jgi:hypothetical protein
MTKQSFHFPRHCRRALRVLKPGGAALLGLATSGKKAVKVAGGKLTKKQFASTIRKRIVRDD